MEETQLIFLVFPLNEKHDDNDDSGHQTFPSSS